MNASCRCRRIGGQEVDFPSVVAEEWSDRLSPDKGIAMSTISRVG